MLLQILRLDFFHTLSDEIDQLGRLDIPIMIVWGKHDASIPLEIGQEMHNILEGSIFEVIDNGGHMPNWDSPAQFNQIVQDFVAESSVHDTAKVVMDVPG
jgi:pimeloyl-ACP methyl ester carboxylesterase